MKIAVGFACLVTIAVQGGVIGAPDAPTDKGTVVDGPVAPLTSGDTKTPVAGAVLDVVADAADDKNDLSQCEDAGGKCQAKGETCDGGQLLKHKTYCGTGNNPYCCIPPGCVYGSKALRNGAIIIRGCNKLKCDKGSMIKDDSDCPNEDDFNRKCGPEYGGLLLNKRCFFSNFENSANLHEVSWKEARDSCVQFKTRSSEPHLPLQLASFADINIADIPTKLWTRIYWTGGSDTAVKDSWKWLDGKIVSAASIPDGCLSVVYNGLILKYADEECDNDHSYICELPKGPSKNCKCNKNTHGCTLGEPNMPDLACQCKLKSIAKGDDVCEGTVVSCEDPHSLDCIHPGTGFEHCMQGVKGRQGNCCGYAAAKCHYGS